MSRTKLANLTVDQLVECFVAIALDQHEAMRHDDNAKYNSFGSASVVRAPTAGAAATVIMFHANEPGAQGAFEAEQVLRQYSS
jgi:hypothetical protein